MRLMNILGEIGEEKGIYTTTIPLLSEVLVHSKI